MKGSYDKFRDYFDFISNVDLKYHTLVNQKRNSIIERKIDYLRFFFNGTNNDKIKLTPEMSFRMFFNVNVMTILRNKKNNENKLFLIKS